MQHWQREGLLIENLVDVSWNGVFEVCRADSDRYHIYKKNQQILDLKNVSRDI